MAGQAHGVFAAGRVAVHKVDGDVLSAGLLAVVGTVTLMRDLTVITLECGPTGVWHASALEGKFASVHDWLASTVPALVAAVEARVCAAGRVPAHGLASWIWTVFL